MRALPLLLLAPAWAALAAGQQVAVSRPKTVQPAGTAGLAPAGSYTSVFEELRHLAPRGDRVAAVQGLTLRRDAIELHLEQGKLYLASPVSGRTVGAVFVGQGSVSFVPPTVVERGQLQRVLGDSALNSRIVAATFLFSDSSAAELERQLTFQTGVIDGDAAGALNDALDRLLDGRTRAVAERTFMTALLNGQANGFFFAHVKRERGEDLMFVVDPEKQEQVELLRRGRERGQSYQVVSQFPREGDRMDSTPVPEGRSWPLAVEAYRIEATIAKGLDFSATAAIRLTSRRAGLRWVGLQLFSELAVDSVSSDTGSADTFYRAKGSPALWVRLGAPLDSGRTRTIQIAWHGDLIGSGSVMREFLPAQRDPRYPPALDRWLFVKSSTWWFPRYGLPPQAAEVDLTFHAPKRYRLASIGQLVESRLDGNVQTTHWVTERPADQVCFNLGEFEEFKITRAGIPPVTVQMNTDAHRQLSQLLLGQHDPGADVGGDVANSLGFFTNVYGPPLFHAYYATEIPFLYGQAFPGLMYLSVMTFQTVNESGGEEMFRAHEMAHQWWGIGVEPAGYRDRWMSEGFAEFSGLWYMQIVLKDNDKFFKKLRDRRVKIRARRNDAGPIALGPRVAETGDPGDYSLVIYSKGAWVLQMLRNMMLNFRTMREDAFIAMMQDFYQEYRGRRASTQDFQRVVERYTGISMDWFFDEWVNGTAIPTYILSWHSEPEADGKHLLRIRVRQEEVPADFVMPVPIRVVFDDGSDVVVRVTVRGKETEGTVRLAAEPTRLELNPLESVLAEVKTEGWH